MVIEYWNFGELTFGS